MKKLIFFLAFFMLFGCSAQEESNLIETSQIQIIHKTLCLAEDTNCVTANYSLDKTNLAWLNSFLLAELSAQPTPTLDFEIQLDNFTINLNKWLDETLAEIKEVVEQEDFYSLNYEAIGNIKFIGQKSNLATFIQHNYFFSGGAHGMYTSQYLLIDLAKKQRIRLQDLIPLNKQTELFEFLKIAYQQAYPEYFESWLPKDINEQKDYLIIDNFYFTDKGITFVYPLYQLAPYSEGEIELSLTENQLKELQN